MHWGKGNRGAVTLVSTLRTTKKRSDLHTGQYAGTVPSDHCSRDRHWWSHCRYLHGVTWHIVRSFWEAHKIGIDLITQSKKTWEHFLLYLQTSCDGFGDIFKTQLCWIDRKSRSFESSVAHSTTDWTGYQSITRWAHKAFRWASKHR